jgi:hypothetical protein
MKYVCLLQIPTFSFKIHCCESPSFLPSYGFLSLLLTLLLNDLIKLIQKYTKHLEKLMQKGRTELGSFETSQTKTWAEIVVLEVV